MAHKAIILAQLATEKVRSAGGFISFEAYDKAMFEESYLVPFCWIAGWGLSFGARKRNKDKMCAFKACEYGLLTQENNGYRLVTAHGA